MRARVACRRPSPPRRGTSGARRRMIPLAILPSRRVRTARAGGNPCAVARNATCRAEACCARARSADGYREALLQQLGKGAGPSLADAERGIVGPSAVQLAHQAHHVRGAERIVRVEPVAEQRLHLARQSQQDVARLARAGIRAAARIASRSRSLSWGITGASITPTGTPADASVRIACSGVGATPPAARGAARGAGRASSPKGRRAPCPSPPSREDVEVALDERALGDDGERVRALREHLENATGNPQVRSIG